MDAQPTPVAPTPQTLGAHKERAPSQILFAELEAVRALLSQRPEPSQWVGPLALVDHIRTLCEADEPEPWAIQKAIRDLDDVLSAMGID